MIRQSPTSFASGAPSKSVVGDVKKISPFAARTTSLKPMKFTSPIDVGVPNRMVCEIAKITLSSRASNCPGRLGSFEPSRPTRALFRTNAVLVSLAENSRASKLAPPPKIVPPSNVFPLNVKPSNIRSPPKNPPDRLIWGLPLGPT